MLEQRGIEIGSHTATHADLPALGDAAARGELASSKQVLERALGHRVPWFAYPYGAYDARVVALVAHAGYLLAVTTKDPKPLEELNPGIPAVLADLIMHLLEKKPEDRPDSATQVLIRSLASSRSRMGDAVLLDA